MGTKNSSRLIIAFTGAIGAGKSTLAEKLQSSPHTPLIDVIPVARYVHATAEEVYTYCLGLEYKKNRALLQVIGDIGREENEDFWISGVVQDITESKANIIIVPDIRYPNEIAYLRRFYPRVIHAKIIGSFKPETTTHDSESSMEVFTDYDLIGEPDTLEKIIIERYLLSP